MTFVVAQQFDDRILIAADTMISIAPEEKTGNDRAPRPDIIPGRLKAIVLAPYISVAYAGAADLAVKAIRAAKQALADGQGIREVERILCDASAASVGGPDFILGSHVEGPSLRRIWDGKISENLQSAVIGDWTLRTVLEKYAAASPLRPLPSGSDGEQAFIEGVRQLLGEIQVTESVGGFYFLLEASPRGHGYYSLAGVTAWDRVWGGTPVSAQQLADRRSGMTEWAYQVSPSRWRGVGVAGAIVLNAGVGYVYSPLVADDAKPWRFSPPPTRDDEQHLLAGFQQAIDQAAAELGGGIDPPPLPRRTHPPSDAELAAIHALAAASPLTTTIEVEAGQLQIGVTTGKAGCEQPLDFALLGDDPVATVRTVVERLAARLQGL